MIEHPLPTIRELPGLEYAHRAFAFNWHGVVRMAPANAMQKLEELVKLTNLQLPGMFDRDIAAVMQQVEVVARASPEQADQEWLTLREMIVDMISKVGGA